MPKYPKESPPDRHQEILQLKGELKRLQDLFNQGRIDEERWQRERMPLHRRLKELVAQEKAEKYDSHRKWFLQGVTSLKDVWATIEDWILSLYEEERTFLRPVRKDDSTYEERQFSAKEERTFWRKKFKEEIEKLAYFNHQSKKKNLERQELREELYEILDSGWEFPDGSRVELHSELIYYYIGFYLRDPEYIGKSREEIRQKKAAARKFYKSISKGRKPRIPEPEKGFGSVIVTWDKEGRPVIKHPGDKWHRPQDKAQKLLLWTVHDWLSRKGLPEKETYNLLKDILWAFCGIRMKDASIKRAIMPDRASPPT